MVDDIEHFYVVIVIRNCKIESRVVRQIKFHIFLIHIQNENNCDEYNNWESLTTLTVIAIILFFSFCKGTNSPRRGISVSSATGLLYNYTAIMRNFDI